MREQRIFLGQVELKVSGPPRVTGGGPKPTSRDIDNTSSSAKTESAPSRRVCSGSVRTTLGRCPTGGPESGERRLDVDWEGRLPVEAETGDRMLL